MTQLAWGNPAESRQGENSLTSLSSLLGLSVTQTQVEARKQGISTSWPPCTKSRVEKDGEWVWGGKGNCIASVCSAFVWSSELYRHLFIIRISIPNFFPPFYLFSFSLFLLFNFSYSHPSCIVFLLLTLIRKYVSVTIRMQVLRQHPLLLNKQYVLACTVGFPVVIIVMQAATRL